MPTHRKTPPNHATERINNARDAITESNAQLQDALLIADECAENERADAWRTLANITAKAAKALRLNLHAKAELQSIEGIETLPDRDAIRLVNRKSG